MFYLQVNDFNGYYNLNNNEYEKTEKKYFLKCIKYNILIILFLKADKLY